MFKIYTDIELYNMIVFYRLEPKNSQAMAIAALAWLELFNRGNLELCKALS